MDEKILLQLTLDVAQVNANLLKTRDTIATLNKQTEEARRKMKELEAAGITSGATYDNLKGQVQGYGTQVKALTKEATIYQNQLVKQAQAEQVQLGSIVQMRSSLSVLTSQWSLLTKAERESADVGQPLKAKIKSLSDELKAEEKAIGDTRRSVGGYSEGILEAIGRMGPFGNAINQGRTIISGFGTAIMNVRDSLKTYSEGLKESVDIGVKHIQVETDKERAVIKGFGATEAATSATVANTTATTATTVATATATTVTGGLSGALRILKVALISTGVGAIVVALGSLIAFLTTTQTGMDLVSKATAAVGAAFKVIIDRVTSFGEGIGKIFTGDFVSGAKEIANSFKGIGTEIAKESQEAFAAKDAMHKLEDAEIAYTQTRAKNQEKISELRLKAKDTNLPIKERADALKQAIEIEEGGLAKELEFAKVRAKLSQEEVDRGKSTREELKANEEQQAKVIQLQTESNDKKRALQKELNGLLGKDDRQRIQDEKEQAKEELNVANELAKEKATLFASARQREIAAEEATLQEHLSKIKGSGEKENSLREQLKEVSKQKEKQINDKFDLEEIAAHNEHIQKLASLDQKRITAENEIAKIDAGTDPVKLLAVRLSEIQNNLSSEINIRKAAAEADVAAVQKAIAEKKISVEDGEKEITAIKNTANTENVASTKKAALDTNQAVRESTDQRIQDALALKQLEIDGSTAGFNEQLKLKLDAINLQEQADIAAVNKSILTEQQKNDAIKAIRAKSNKDQEVAGKQSTDTQLAIASGGLGQVAGLLKKGSIEYKAFAAGQAIIDTYRAATAALSPPPVGAGPIFGPILAGVAIATGLANIAKINSVQAARGMVLKGPSHTSGGIPFTVGGVPGFEAEGDEILMTKGVYRNPQLRKMASDVNVAGGGIAFAGGGIIPSQYSFINTQVQQSVDISQLISVLRNQPPTIVTVEDINIGQSRVAIVEQRANL